MYVVKREQYAPVIPRVSLDVFIDLNRLSKRIPTHPVVGEVCFVDFVLGRAEYGDSEKQHNASKNE